MSSGHPQTRENILRATFELVGEERNPAVSMSKIAARAGVSRQAVYLHFESRTALLLAMVEWSDASLGLDAELGEALAIVDPAERLFAALRVGARYEPKIADIARAMDMTRHTDGAVAAAWEDRMERRRGGYAQIMAELADAGRLVADLTPREAAEAVVNVSSPASYANLVLECGWSRARWEEWIVETVQRSLLG